MLISSSFQAGSEKTPSVLDGIRNKSVSIFLKDTTITNFRTKTSNMCIKKLRRVLEMC